MIEIVYWGNYLVCLLTQGVLSSVSLPVNFHPKTGYVNELNSFSDVACSLLSYPDKDKKEHNKNNTCVCYCFAIFVSVRYPPVLGEALGEGGQQVG